MDQSHRQGEKANDQANEYEVHHFSPLSRAARRGQHWTNHPQDEQHSNQDHEIQGVHAISPSSTTVEAM
jgi:hypothetical protein